MEQDEKNQLANALRGCTPLHWQSYLGGKPLEKYGVILTEEAREKIIAALVE
jgi:hypothetical protein